MSLLLLGAGASPPLRNAVVFDGTNDYMQRGADLTGNADGKKGLVSVWFRLNGGNDAAQRIFATEGGIFYFDRAASNKITVVGYTAAIVQVLGLTSTASYTAGSSLIHLLAAWDLATATGQMYVNGADDLAGGSTLTNLDIDYTRTDHAFGSSNGGSSKCNMDIAEAYVNLAETLDISNAANRAKFRTASGTSANLGTDGSTPTGIAPIVYFKHAPGAAATDFATNRGGGGNFTITGTLTEANGA